MVRTVRQISPLPPVYVKDVQFPNHNTRWSMCLYSNYVHLKCKNRSVVAIGYEAGLTREPVLLFHKKKMLCRIDIFCTFH